MGAAAPPAMPGFSPTAVERAAERAASARDAALGADPGRRRRHGIVHTPPALARAVVALADRALREHLGLARGVADPALTLIDPACGPGAFLAAALAVGDTGSAPRAVVGLDLDGTAVAHAREALSEPFAAAGWPLQLTRADTLCEPRWLEPEGDGPVLVLGNPPWAGSAQPTPAPFLAELLVAFRRDAAGAPLGERKVGVLADPYVRFVCWAMERVRRAPGGGVVALVTNGSFLDGPVHRGMRARMLERFDPLQVVDLGGNALLSRRGARDENVFGVRPGVAISVGVCSARSASSRQGRLRLAVLRGTTPDKLATLLDADRLDRALAPVAPERPLLRFVRATPASARYAGFVSLADAMPFHREGVQTNRDAVVIDADRAHLLARLRRFADGDASPDLERARTPLRHYDPERARAAVAEALARDPDGTRGLLVPIAYRPFDTRWFAAVTPLCHRPRPALLAAMAHAPLALVTVRKDRGSAAWAHFAAAAHVVDNCFLSLRSSCRARAFSARTPAGEDNLDAGLARHLSELRGAPVDAAAFVRYALAVMASSRYRALHDEALRTDYPRLPLPSSAAAFEAALEVGDALVDLFCHPPAQRVGVTSPSDAALPVGHHGAGLHGRALAACVARADALSIDWG